MARKPTPARTRAYIGYQARPTLKPLALALLAMAPLSAAPVLAAEGGQVIHGQGGVTRNGNATTVNQQSNALILNWANFNIAPNERVQFLQPSSSSLALNRVLSNDPTAIFGQLLANGQIFLVNPHGITFGAGAQVNVAGLVASTLDISNADFLGGAATGKFTFSGAGNGRIVNQGAIAAEKGGYVALIARQVSNQGSLAAPEGSVALAAGDRVTLSHASGLLNVSVEAATLDALVENKQAIRADGGLVILSAKAENALLSTVVNQTGIIEARSIENKNGRIFLSGGSSGVVNLSGTLDASGKNPGEHGGDVTVTGANIALNKGTSIDASGAVAGGSVLVGGDYQGAGDTPHANALWMDAAAGIAANATLDGPGGKVVLWSDEATRAYGSISATGTQAGGLVETSGHYLDVAGIKVDASSPLGAVGLWLLDPNNISIQPTGANTNISAGPNFTSTKDSAILTTATIQSALNAGSGTSVTVTTASASPNTQAGNITFAANSKIAYTGTNAGVGLTLNADNNITAAAGTDISSSAGKLDVTFNAGKQASGTGVITLATTTISSKGGKISLNGAPNGGGAAGARGLQLTGSTLDAGGGNILLSATGGTNSATTNRGIELSGSTLSTTGNGAISLTGVGGSKTTNYGVFITSTSKLQSVDGNITVNGTAGAASTGTGIGVLMDTTSSIVSGKGKIAITGTGSSGATSTSNHGVQINSTAGITSTSGDIQINGSSGTGTSNDNGVRLIGGSPLSTGGNITITGISNGKGTTTNYGVEINASSATTSGTGTISITGTGGGGGTKNYGTLVTSSSKLQSAGGAVTLIGNAGSASTGTGIGLLLDGTASIATTTGDIFITGAGSSGSTGTANQGVQINTTGAIGSTSGNIQVTGTSGTGTSNDGGVRVIGGSTLATGGNITLAGTSSAVGTTNNIGVEVNNGKLTTSGAGNVSITGTGGGKTNNYGAYVTASSKLETASGTLTVIGNAGAASSGAGIGVLLDNKASLVSAAGNISMTGTGSTAATGTGNHGVQINSTGGVVSTGGNIQINGTSGTGTGTDMGVRILGASPITTGGSSIAVTGKSLSTGAANSNNGVDVSGASILTNSNATGLIDLNGTAGGGAGSNHFGVSVAGSTVQATGGGSINLTGVGGGKFAGISIAATNPVIGNAATKDITLTASNGGGGDALAIAAGSKLLGTGTLTVQGPNAATTMGIGGAASSTFNLQMDTTELGLIQPGFANLVFGRGDGTGAITVGAGTANANTTIQGSASNIAINGAFATNASKLTLSTAGTVSESGTGALTVNAGAGALQLQNGGTFNLTNNNNTGTLNVTGTALNIRDDTGFAVSGIATTGNVTLSTVGNVTQTGAIVSGGSLNLNGAGGVYNLCTQNNDIVTLNANTKTVAFKDINTYALGTLTLTGALELAGDFGSSGNVTAGSFMFDAPSKNVTFNNSGTIATLAANVAGLNYSQANSLTIGKVTNTFCNPGTVNGITSSGNVAIKTTAANSDITLAANTPISFTGAAPGTVKLEAQRNLALNAGSSIGSSGQAIDVTLNANLQGVAAGGGGVTLTSATITSNNGSIVLAGDPSGTGFASNKAGNGIGLNAATLDAGSGAITLRGESRGAANASGVALINSSSVKSSAGTISITGKNADTSALAGQTGVSIASNSLVSANGANNITVTGTSGTGTGAGNAGVVVQTGGRISATNGALTVTGTSTSAGSQPIGILVTGASSKIDSAGNGAMNLTGQGSSAGSASNAAGISIASTANVTGKDGVTNLIGTGGANSAGVEIANATAGANGLGTFTIAGKGNGMAAGIATSGAQPILLVDQGGTLILEASNGGGADALVLAATSKIQGNGNLIVRGANAGDTMGIGGAASAAHNLQIDKTELTTIQPGLANITFGRSDGTGLITIGDGSTNAATTIQAASANMDITGAFATIGADLSLTTAGIATESASGHNLVVNGGAGTLNLLGGGTYNLCKGDNDTGTLTANATELAFNDINDLALGTPFNVTNDVALGVNGTLTASSGINSGGLALFGANVTFNNAGNVGKLAATVTGDLIYSQTNSYAIDTVNNACLGGAVNGITAGGNVSLAVGAGNSVTQSATGLIGGNGLTLHGGLFNLTENNSVATLTANAEELALRADLGFAVGGLNIGGATRLISNGGAVTQTGAIVSDGLALTGSGGVFNLSDTGNAIVTLAGDTGDLRFVSSAGYVLGSVTTNSDGVTVAGVKANTVGLTSSGAVTQDATGLINATGLSLNGVGGTFNLNQTGNDVQTLALDTRSVRFADGNGFAIGSVTTAADGLTTIGANAASDLGLTSNGAVAQIEAILTPALALNGAGGAFNLNNAGNDVATLAADSGEIFFRDGNGFAIGAVTTSADGLTTTGMTATGTIGLESSGSVTQAAPIVAPGLALTGAGGNFVLKHAANNAVTLAGNTQRIDYSQSGALAIGAVTGADGSVTNGIDVSDRVTVQTTDLLANLTLTLNSPVVAHGTGFAAVLSTQRDFINNVGATGVQTPNGNWALYANNPLTSVFNGLTAPTTLFGQSITTLPPASLPAGANAIVFQSLQAPVPPTGRDPTPAGVNQVGLQLLTLDTAESLYTDLLSDVNGYDFLDRLKRYGYVPLEVMYGGMKVPEGLSVQEVDLQKLRRRLGIGGDPGHRYIWWR